MELKSYFCKSLTEFYQISLKILPNLTDFSSQLMACMTRSNIFSNVCAKSLTCIEAILLHRFFFQRDTSFVTTANEKGGKYESGRAASPESIPSNKNGIHSTHL